MSTKPRNVLENGTIISRVKGEYAIRKDAKDIYVLKFAKTPERSLMLNQECQTHKASFTIWTNDPRRAKALMKDCGECFAEKYPPQAQASKAIQKSMKDLEV